MSSVSRNDIQYLLSLVLLLLVYAVLLVLSTGVVVFKVDLGTNGATDGLQHLALAFGFYPERAIRLTQFSYHTYISQGILLLMAVAVPVATVTTTAAITLLAAVSLLCWHLLVAPAAWDVQFSYCLAWLMVLYCTTVLIKIIDETRNRWLVRRAVQRYAPSQLTRHYTRNPAAIAEAGESRVVTIMFCDIRKFTLISERELNTEELPDWLNGYFSTVSVIVEAHGGTVDKYMGDSVMAFWGAPEKSESHAHDALLAGVEILAAIEQLSKQFASKGLPAISIGIGISTGLASVGNLGAKNRRTYTVVGDAVNQADRLQTETRVFHTPIIVNDALIEQVPGYLFREIDSIKLKGRNRRVRIYDPISHQKDATPDTHRRLQSHRKALQFLAWREWDNAIPVFRQLKEQTGETKFYDVYLEKIAREREAENSKDSGDAEVTSIARRK